MRVTAPAKTFSNGFTEEDDIFGRKVLHDQIVRIATNAPDRSLVLALDDKWGNGKTSFVKMMSSEIKNHNPELNVIYFDAFESDYQSDPFVALSSKIYSLLKSEDGKIKTLGEKLLSVGKKIGASFAINGAKFAVGAITGGVVNGSVLEAASDTITDSLSSPIEAFIEGKIKSGEQEIATIEHFREILSEIYKVSGKKTIFIIDELDRARPDFALDLLEKIKHIFSVEGFVFLLVMNRSQFERSIECRYGKINARLYLNKFIHYWFTLPKIDHLSEDVVAGYKSSTILRYLLALDYPNKLLVRGSSLVKTLAYLLEVNNCSLREAERCYSVFCVMENPQRMDGYVSDILKAAMGMVAFLKVHNQEMLYDIVNKRVTLETSIKALNIHEHHAHDSPEVYYVLHALEYHFSTDDELAEKRKAKHFSDIESFIGRRVKIFEKLVDSVDGFQILY
ncbi:KAP family P-loop NTPase fold protein [Serratia sarumanii]|uniref:KAP family P-loop NTPase fold protein n=1 Tax=Serratia sarumanii TaxID=3020826 RepID=UPI003D7D05BF